MTLAKPATIQINTSAALDSLVRAEAWLNSPALSAGDLRGKVVLVDFWTYSCINWRRTLPWLRHWANKYRQDGLVIVGVHTPEFSFEADLDNVRRATAEQGIGYPVAVDSRYAIWDSFANQYWPALYFVDAQGRIRHRHFGEGDYEHLERVILQLLSESGGLRARTSSEPAPGAGAEAAADWKNLKSPETYVGNARAERFASPGGSRLDRSKEYALPARLNANEWALQGLWSMHPEFSVLEKSQGRVAYQFQARDVHLVMGPRTRGESIRFRVTLDGKPPGDAHGVDVDADGYGNADQPRMYNLIRQSGPTTSRKFELEVLEPGLQIYVFTFG